VQSLAVEVSKLPEIVSIAAASVSGATEMNLVHTWIKTCIYRQEIGVVAPQFDGPEFGTINIFNSGFNQFVFQIMFSEQYTRPCH
jgi:hypothetical protein